MPLGMVRQCPSGAGTLGNNVPLFECQYAIACKVREPANQSAAVGSMGAKFPDEQIPKQTPGDSSDPDLDGVDRSHEHKLTIPRLSHLVILSSIHTRERPSSASSLPAFTWRLRRVISVSDRCALPVTPPECTSGLRNT